MMMLSERRKINWTRDVRDEAARQVEKRKPPERIYGCSEVRHEDG